VRIAGSYGALAVSSGAGSAHNVSHAVTGVLGRGVASSHISEHDVRVVMAHDRRDQAGWSVQVARLHRQLRADFGTVSLGYAAPRAGTGAGKRALAEAVEALHVGDRVFGAGHLTSYGDARLAAFLRGHVGVVELRSLYEHAVGKLLFDDLSSGSDLVATLEAYCHSGASIHDTAERLGVHRNTVLNRMRRIRSLTQTSVDDGSSRLLLQVGLLAGRIVGQPQLA
jgi:DNA-binding PucR family transcriptional regulator